MTLKPRHKLNEPSSSAPRVKSFIIDDEQGALSAGRAIVLMTLADPDPTTNPAATPLFRDAQTGKEIDRALAQNRFKECLVAAGLQHVADARHSLRRGGAAAHATSEHGPALVEAFMDVWALQRKWGSERLEQIARNVAKP